MDAIGRMSVAFFIRGNIMAGYYNASHCVDKTCAEAMANVAKKEKEAAAKNRAKDFMGAVLRLAGLCGFYVTKLTIQDRRTGKTFRR